MPTVDKANKKPRRRSARKKQRQLTPTQFAVLIVVFLLLAVIFAKQIPRSRPSQQVGTVAITRPTGEHSSTGTILLLGIALGVGGTLLYQRLANKTAGQAKPLIRLVPPAEHTEPTETPEEQAP